MNALKSLTAAVPFRRRSPPTNPCAICMDDMVIGDKLVEKLPNCNHLFHARCILRWLCVKRNCPICRCETVLPRKQLYRMLEATDPSMLYHQRQDVHVYYVEFKPPKFLWVYQLRDLIEALFPELYEHFRAKFGYR